MGGFYEFFKTASANLRQKDDTINEAVGGFFSGSVVGLRGTSASKDAVRGSTEA